MAAASTTFSACSVATTTAAPASVASSIHQPLVLSYSYLKDIIYISLFQKMCAPSSNSLCQDKLKDISKLIVDYTYEKDSLTISNYEDVVERTIKLITIVDARDSGLEQRDIEKAVDELAWKELKGEGSTWVSSYIKEEYFKNIPISPGIFSPENIFLAKINEEIVGFLITAKRKSTGIGGIPADTSYIPHLAVDSRFKKLGLGTKLMLVAMRKTKELGKRFLTLEYLAEGRDLDEERCRTKIAFYNSFTPKFGIPMEINEDICCRQLLRFLRYDLKELILTA